MTGSLWDNHIYFRTFLSVIVFLIFCGALIYYLQRLNPKWTGAWASVKSYLVLAPVIFGLSGLNMPWPYVAMVFIAIFAMKTFFRMTGMYHRTYFVWSAYAMIALQGYLVYIGNDRFFNLLPMLYCLGLSLIPLFRNSPTQMIQYVALTLMGFIYFGWGFMHFSRMLSWDTGLLIILYLIILSEFSENMLYLGNRYFGRTRPLDNVTSRFTVEGFIFSIFLTLILAWGIRSLLPVRSEAYWVTLGLICSVWGRLGSFTFSFMRRDLGIKEAGVFIIGRDDILARLDKLMFIAPASYYALLILQGKLHL
jgi:phosphatidate cytidylyltransferase